MSRKKTENTRRKLLKTAVLGGGALTTMKTIPEKWSKPIVDSISLPAHAVTTGTSPGGGGKMLSTNDINHKNLDYENV